MALGIYPPQNTALHFFKKKLGHSRPLFLYFRLFNTVDNRHANVLYVNLPMTGFEPRTPGVGSKLKKSNKIPKNLTFSASFSIFNQALVQY